MIATVGQLSKLACEVRQGILLLSSQGDRTIARIEQFLQRRCAKRFRFPDNWCDFASIALADCMGRQLDDAVPIILIVADITPDEMERHFWVRYLDIDIDITCGQFSGMPEIVVERNSALHKERFKITSATEFFRRRFLAYRFEILVKMLSIKIDSTMDYKKSSEAFELIDDVIKNEK